MAKPIQIADAKISLAVTSAIAKLRGDVEAIHRRAAAKHMLKSGNTIIEVQNECIAVIKSIGDTASQEFSWVLSQSFFANPMTVDECNTSAHRILGGIRDACSDVLKNTVNLCGDDRHFAITEPKLREQEGHSLMAISLALDTRYSELKLQGMRTLLGVIQRVLYLIIGHR